MKLVLIEAIASVVLLGTALAVNLPAAEGEEPAAQQAKDGTKSDAEAEAARQRFSRFVTGAFQAARDALRVLREPGLEMNPELLLPSFIAEYKRQFRPILTAELMLIDSVCQPTPDERNTIKAAGKVGLERVVKEHAELRLKLHRTRYRSRQGLEWPNPRKVIAAALVESVEGTLSPEKAKRYRSELDERAAARTRAARIYALAKLDKALLFSPEQRGKVLEVMEASWREEWTQNLEGLQHEDHYMPVLPDDKVLPLLSEVQKQVWNARSKKQNLVSGWAGFGLMQPLENETEDEAEDEAAEEEGKAAEKPEEGR